MAVTHAVCAGSVMPMRGIVVILSLLLLGAPAYGQSGHHGQGHAQNHDWYKELNQPGTTYSCCNARTDKNPDGDCRPTRAYQTEDGTWRALLNGRWVPVPPKTVLQTLAPDGRSHICANPSGTIFCFLGGSPRS
jgi:hypothetical protein